MTNPWDDVRALELAGHQAEATRLARTIQRIEANQQATTTLALQEYTLHEYEYEPAVKSVTPEAKQATDTQATDPQPASILDSMLTQAQHYIDTEPDPEDQATMRDIIASLQDLLNKDQAEGEA